MTIDEKRREFRKSIGGMTNKELLRLLMTKERTKKVDTEKAGTFIREDLEPYLKEIFTKSFPAFDSMEPSSFKGLRGILETGVPVDTVVPRPKVKRAARPVERPHNPDSIYGRALKKYTNE